jgi:predicted transcriptional regulator
MQNQPKREASPTAGLSEEQVESAVLDCMLLGEAWPWSVDEIALELGDTTSAEDAVRRLVQTGLAHRLGEFVFPTRTARRASQLEVGTG